VPTVAVLVMSAMMMFSAAALWDVPPLRVMVSS